MSMQVYGDLNGNSGITGYRVSDDDDYIDIEFQSGGVYRYNRDSVGHTNFEVIKALANAGAGLCRFLNNLRKRGYQFTPRPEPTPTPTQPVCVKLDAHEAVPVITELVRSGIKVSLNS